MSMSPLNRYKLKAYMAFMLAYSVCYLIPNLLPFFPPKQLPMHMIDFSTPLLPWTFLIYTSDYFLVFLVILLHPTIESFRRLERQAFFVLFICGVFFIFYPTTYPRPTYPSDTNKLIAFAMWVVRFADTPNNCLPSLHVALTGIATLSLRLAFPRFFIGLVFWSVAIFVSTLTTKQHYIVDVVAGVAVIALAIGLNEIWVRRFKTSSVIRIGIE